MKQLTTFTLIMLLTAFLLTSCEKPITEGEVVNKVYEPAQTYVIMYPMTVSSGKTITTIMVPMIVYDDEDWIIKIQKFDENKQKWRYRTIWVTSELYHSIAVGGWFLIDKNCEFNDPDIKRRKDE